jgi:isopentenyldiphosphate isomerase
MEEVRVINGQEFISNTTPIKLYDENGIFLTMGTLDQAVEQGLWCKSVHVWLLNKSGELYLQQRSMKVMNNPGKWSESGGGYIDNDMTSEETVETEMREELGLTLTSEMYHRIGVVKQIEKRVDGKETKQFVDVYLVEADITAADIYLDERDVAGGVFMPWQDFSIQHTAGEIDFVDHPEEIQIVLQTLRGRHLV